MIFSRAVMWLNIVAFCLLACLHVGTDAYPVKPSSPREGAPPEELAKYYSGFRRTISEQKFRRWRWVSLKSTAFG